MKGNFHVRIGRRVLVINDPPSLLIILLKHMAEYQCLVVLVKELVKEMTYMKK